MTDHAEVGQHVLKLLGHVLAQITQATAAGRAGIGLRSIHAFVARQVSG
jgi:hypothetical protein